MSQRDLKRSRMSLTQALTRSYSARNRNDPDGRAVAEHLGAAELRLRDGGREDLGYRLSELRDEPTTGETRAEIRELISLIDAEISPAVDTGSFVPASDGGIDR